MANRAGWWIAALALIGCGTPAVRWEVPVSAPGDTTGQLSVNAGLVTFSTRLTHPALPADSARCQRSEAFATDGPSLYASWLRRRPNGGVIVVAARSSDSGRSWSVPGIVDSVDVGRTGCDHPVPSIAASAGYVHVAYSLDAPEGFGVFFAHSMDQTATFHSPIPVIYGDRLSATSVAADGMRVAVAYEEPSGSGHHVDVALSTTQGHSFDGRVRGSPDEMEASRPELALSGGTIVLSFDAAAGGVRTMRLGHLR